MPEWPELVRLRNYLWFLLDLVSRRVLRRSDSPDPVRDELLTQQFYQPFGDLASGAIPAADQPIHPARVPIEVLRSYLTTLNVPDLITEALNRAEAEYRLNAYQALLRSIGTSYEEIRLVRDPRSPDRERLAERLGVPSDGLQALILTDRITERALERIFGLVDTHPRDPQPNPPEPQLLASRKTALRQAWKKQDHPADSTAAGTPPPI